MEKGINWQEGKNVNYLPGHRYKILCRRAKGYGTVRTHEPGFFLLLTVKPHLLHIVCGPISYAISEGVQHLRYMTPWKFDTCTICAPAVNFDRIYSQTLLKAYPSLGITSLYGYENLSTVAVPPPKNKFKIKRCIPISV